MTDIILPTKEEEENPRAYVLNKLVPAVQELHRITREFFVPGSIKDMELLDLTTSEPSKRFADIDTRANRTERKAFTFSVDPKIPFYEGNKKLKCMLTMTVYSVPAGTVAFRLVNSTDNVEVEGSEIVTTSEEPTTVVRYLEIGHKKGQVSPHETTYHVQAKYLGAKSNPICRRIEMTAVYV